MTYSLGVHTVDIHWLANRHQKIAKTHPQNEAQEYDYPLQHINHPRSLYQFTAHYHTIRKHTFKLGMKFIIFAGRDMTCPFLSLKRGNNESFFPIQRRQILLKFNAIIINVNKYHHPLPIR
jgi:hypothetical protein